MPLCLCGVSSHRDTEARRIGANDQKRFCSCCFVASPAFAQSGTWARQPAGTMAWLTFRFLSRPKPRLGRRQQRHAAANTDGGTTWKPRSASTDDVVRDIFFIDEKNGWIVCEVNAYQLKTVDEPRAYLMRTTDGGEKWNRIEIKDFNFDSILVRAVFTRNGRGWAFGEGGAIYALAMPAIPGSGCDRQHVACCSAACLLTTIEVGSSAQAPRSFKHQTAEIPGINRSCRKLKSRFVSPPHRLSTIAKGGQSAAPEASIAPLTEAAPGNDKIRQSMWICLM